jgi:hypothetical protein
MSTIRFLLLLALLLAELTDGFEERAVHCGKRVNLVGPRFGLVEARPGVDLGVRDRCRGIKARRAPGVQLIEPFEEVARAVGQLGFLLKRDAEALPLFGLCEAGFLRGVEADPVRD